MGCSRCKDTWPSPNAKPWRSVIPPCSSVPVDALNLVPWVSVAERVIMLMTPLTAFEPHIEAPGPLMTSIRSRSLNTVSCASHRTPENKGEQTLRPSLSTCCTFREALGKATGAAPRHSSVFTHLGRRLSRICLDRRWGRCIFFILFCRCIGVSFYSSPARKKRLCRAACQSGEPPFRGPNNANRFLFRPNDFDCHGSDGGCQWKSPIWGGCCASTCQKFVHQITRCRSLVFAHQTCPVNFHSTVADAQGTADFLRGQSAHQMGSDLAFTGG